MLRWTALAVLVAVATCGCRHKPGGVPSDPIFVSKRPILGKPAAQAHAAVVAEPASNTTTGVVQATNQQQARTTPPPAPLVRGQDDR